MKPYTQLSVAALLLGGCGACTAAHGPAPRGAPSRTTTPSITALAGGCGGMPLRRGAPPAWNPRPAGFTKEPPDLPYVLGRRDTVMGYVFNAPLVAPTRAGKNKILWYVRQPRHGSPLRIAGHPAGADHPEVTRQFPADSSPGEIYPSGVEVPHPGCWVFTLTWDGHEDDVVLRFSPAARPHVS